MSSPFRIFAYCADRTLGDFLRQNVFAASVKKCFPDSELLVYMRPDRPYKPEVIAMNTHIDRVLQNANSLPVDWFDIAFLAPFRCPVEAWYEQKFPDVDLVLFPGMMGWDKLGGLPAHARLTFQEEWETELLPSLLACNLRPDKWFACIHAKEPNYKFRPNSGAARDVNPQTYYELACYIIDELGGQVVRLGDPTMQPFPPTPGLIDLSRREDAFLLHAYAVSRSRFLIAADSGIHPLGPSLGVPTGATNLLSHALPWGTDDLILTKTVVDSEGRSFRQQAALEAGLLDEGILERGYNVVDNTAAELCRVADALFTKTQDCPGWRCPAPDTDRPSGHLTFPLPSGIKAAWF